MRQLFWTFAASLLSLPALSLSAQATGLHPDPAMGQPQPEGIGLQAAASPVKLQMEEFHNHLLLPITVGITVFVMLLLFWVMIRYNSKANPVPSKTTHNTAIEVVWTIVPILILLAIGAPSLRLLYFTERSPESTEMTLKVIGHQWYWEYAYPDANGITFSTYMKKQDELLAGEPRLLETDRRVVLPIDTNIKIIVTATDVLHSWAVPAFGVKRDAVPGRLNETWVRITKPGVYYGQCSELCGQDHAFMPIAIEAVTKDAYAAWVAKEQAEEGLVPAAATAPATTSPTAPATTTTTH